MQTIQSTQVVTPVDQQLLGHVRGLLEYAKTDAKFACSLAYYVQSKKWHDEKVKESNLVSRYLIPQTQTEAIQTANWALQRLDKNPETKYSRGLLSTWAQDFESPKDLVFGIVGLAIIGPTLGIIKKNKNVLSQLQIVINKSWYENHSAKEVASFVQKISMGVIAKELRLAGGSVLNLHPDTAAWCLEEPLTKIYLSSQTELKSIEKTVQAENLSHQLNKKDDLTIAVAISPTVNDNFVTDFEIKEA